MLIYRLSWLWRSACICTFYLALSENLYDTYTARSLATRPWEAGLGSAIAYEGHFPRMNGASHMSPGDSAASEPAPTPINQRIESIDVLRGLVLLGILFMNIPLFGLPHQAAKHPNLSGGIEGLDWWAWFLSGVLWDGKMRALFSMLFGAGAVLLTRRAESAGPEGRARTADIYYRRMLWLMLFGIIDGYVLGWFGDILYWYGVTGLILYPLRRLKPRAIIIAASVILLSGIGMHALGHEKVVRKQREVWSIQAAFAAGHQLRDKDYEKLIAHGERRKEQQALVEKIKKEAEARKAGYFSAIFETASVCTKWNSAPLYMDSDVIPMMLLGIAFANAGVITGRRSTRFYLITALVCLPLGWMIAGRDMLAWSNSGFDIDMVGSYADGAAWSYPTQRLLLALAYLSIVMLIARAGILRFFMQAIAAAGRMPLTNYLAQSVICLFIFTGAGFAMLGEFSRWQLVVLALGIWLAQVISSTLWLKWFAYGPMEWIWRWLAYRQRPQWRLHDTA